VTREDPALCWAAGADMIVTLSDIGNNLKKRKREVTTGGILKQIASSTSKVGKTEQEIREDVAHAQKLLEITRRCSDRGLANRLRFKELELALDRLSFGDYEVRMEDFSSTIHGARWEVQEREAASELRGPGLLGRILGR
jgi:hypothetical protein